MHGGSGVSAITDGAGRAANATLPVPGSAGSLGRSGGIAIDTDAGQPRPPPSPVAVYVQSPGGGRAGAAEYSAGDAVSIAVEFSAPVAVHARGAGGLPYLELRTGSAGARAPYASGNGTDTLAFAYAVRGGDMASRVSYAGTGALILNGSAIVSATGPPAPAVVALPAPGAAGSLEGGPPARIATERPVLHVGILDEAGPGGAVSAAAALAAADFNGRQGRAPGAPLVNATAYGAGSTAESAAAALRAAHANGSGPLVFIGPSTDRGLHAAMPYAAEAGIILASAGSTAPSLAAPGDAVFRLLPSGVQQAAAIASLVNDAGAESVVIVSDDAAYSNGTGAGGGFRHGLADALSRERFASVRAVVLAGPPSGWAGEARELEGAASAGRADAVVFLGAGEAVAALAGHAPGLDRARWFATDAAANSPALLADPDAAAFAASARLAAVSYPSPAGDAARAVDAALSAAGADAVGYAGAAAAAYDAGGTVPYAARYAAYDAMAVLARAANASADLAPRSLAPQIPPAAAAYDGALGDILLDAAGDLWLPNRYDVWTVRAGQGGGGYEWSARPAAASGVDSCSIRLGSSALDMRVNLGGYSTVSSQTVINSGSQGYKNVQLQPTPWYIDPDGRPAPGHPSLPASLAELSRTGPRSAFEAITDRSTHVADGLPPGERDRLWFRVNLTAYTESPGGALVQYVTYVAECAAAR